MRGRGAIWNRRFLAAVAAASALLIIAPAQAERRVALVVGNARYQFLPKLRTPPSDADHVTALLRNLDFQVTEIKDGDKATIEQSFRKFAEDIAGADVALFYYSGHGAQVDDNNYILPTSARIDNQKSLALDAFAVPDVNSIMRAAGAKIQLLFLDACRNNPFAEHFSTVRSVPSRGLAAQDAGTGALIAFSAGPGQIAFDGNGDVSPFTAGFLQFGAEPNIEIRQMLARVRGYVAGVTQQSQVPWQRNIDPSIYRKRNLVERLFNKLKHFRRIATRFDKLARNFLAAVALASVRLWTRAYESTT